MSDTSQQRAWPVGGGETGALLRSHDWAATSLGPIDLWPQSLKSVVDLVLASQIAMNLLWGPERIQIYNEANKAFLGEKHPYAFGRPAREHWGEVWDEAEALNGRVFAGETVTLENHAWTLIRNGQPEQAFFTTYLTPVRDEAGAVAGILAAAFETTEAVNATRERKRFEQSRQESEARLQSAADLVGLGWSYWRPDSSAVLWDNRTRAIWGLSPDAPIDLETAVAAVHAEDRHKVEAIRVDARDPASYSYKLEYRVIGIEDGVERWIAEHGRSFYDEGSPKAFVSAVLDITEVKRKEEMLRDSQARLAAILDQLPVGVGLCDMEGRILLSNRQLRDFVGEVIPSRDAGLSERWRAFASGGEPLEPSNYPGARALRGETVVPGIDLMHVDERGRATWIRMSAAPFRSEAGQIVGAVVMLQDVDNEKRALKRLLESEARLQAAADLVHLGLYAWNPRTNGLQWDETVKAIWGLPANAEIDYDTWRRTVHPDDLERIEGAIRRSADPAGDGQFDVEYRVIGISDGEERWVATRGRTEFEHGEAAAFYGVAVDVTDRKRVEAVLERRVEARTRELEIVNRQLRSQIEQRKFAEAAVQQLQRLDAIGQITSGVAHDFNNLLTVVLTNARLLSRLVRDPDDQEGVELILAAAERGATLTAQLLAFSRKQQLEPQAVALNGKIEGMIDLLGVTLGDTVRLELVLDPDLWSALVDPTQIELIILNLALNARDAMQAGGTLTLQTFNTIVEREPLRLEEPAPGHYVGLAVNDTGVGIPDEVLGRVFEPFFTTKAPGKGSGLGLAQVFGVAKQSGGGVRIGTQLAVGTSVTVYLPRVEQGGGNAENSRDDTGRTSRATSSSTILVVDDDKDVLRSTLRMLNFLGYAAVPASNGVVALALLRNHPEINLVLADYAMPEMGGVELASAIGAEWPELPVIVVTGNSATEAIEKFGELRILQKPYTERELTRMIKATLG